METRHTTPHHDVVVVGGGIAGLTAAYTLHKAGVDVLVLEAGDYPGGRIRTLQYGHHYAEAGGSVVTSDEPETLDLIKELGLGPLRELGTHGVEMCVGPTFLHLSRIDGRVGSWRDVRSLLRFGWAVARRRECGLPLPGPRLLGAYRRALRVIEEQSEHITFPYEPAAFPEWDSVSFGEFLDRFHPALKHYVDIQLTVTAGQLADKISLFWGLVTFYWNVEGHFYWLEGGMSQLPRTLAAQLESQIRLNATVNSVVRGNSPTIHYQQGRTEQQVQARAVIFATPPRVAAALLDSMPPQKQAALLAVPFGAYLLVNLHCRKRFWNSLVRTGFVNCAGLTFADLVDATRSQPGEAGVLTCFIAGPQATRLLDIDDLDIAASVIREVAAIFPDAKTHIRDWEIIRWPNAIPYFPPHYQGTLTELRRPLENLYFCGDYTHGAGIHDAVRSGQIAAQDAAACLPTLRH